MGVYVSHPTAAITAVLLLFGSTACGDGEPDEDAAPEFPSGSGQEPRIDEGFPYPPGPFGIGVGSVMINYQFLGYVDPLQDMGSGLVTIELAEFYNPTGDQLWGADSVFPEGTPKPVALMIDMSAVWCPPCQYEADVVLPVRHEQYRPLGMVMCNLAESGIPGVPATPEDLDNWATRYDVSYPLVLDPRYRFFAMNPQPAWPGNFIIDTRTMTLVDAVAGVPDAEFWGKFEAVIAGTHR